MIHKAQTLASMLPVSSCPERNLRLKRYDDAVRAYRIAVVLLDAALPLQDFDAAYRLAEKARKVLERSRQEFEAHVAAHCCHPRNL
jgi:hypothetical protein